MLEHMLQQCKSTDTTTVIIKQLRHARRDTRLFLPSDLVLGLTIHKSTAQFIHMKIHFLQVLHFGLTSQLCTFKALNN